MAKKLMSPEEYEKKLDKEVAYYSHQLGINPSAAGNTLNEKYYFIMGVKGHIKKIKR